VQRVLRRGLSNTAVIRGAVASDALEIPDAEKVLVANSVPARRAEFTGGRWCAHRALEELGCPTNALLRGPLGAPLWPSGIVGSITHESEICLAVVAHATSYRGIGIDLFDCRRDVDMHALSHLVLTERDRARCASADAEPFFLKLAFSAKESVIKAVSEKIGRFLELTEIDLSTHGQLFQATIAGHSCRVAGRWDIAGPFIVTMAILDHERTSMDMNSP
jgi:enterobactin synthetase component D